MRAALIAAAVLLFAAAPAAAAPTLVSLGSFSQPVHVASPPQDPRVFVVERAGLVKIVGAGTFLDVRALTESGYQEQGLLSIAFPPDYATSGLFYVYLTAKPDNSLKVIEFSRSADPNRADPASAHTVVSVPHPGSPNLNHDGGQLQFGPGGFLYIGTGDGGGGDDPEEDAQNLSSELGKILRVNAHTGTAAAGNPFGTRVWSYGLRNPWRFTFDRSTGDLLIGDVGQDQWEEVDWAPAAAGGGKGVNYGWPCREGLVDNAARTCTAASAVNPVFVRSHPTYRAIVGGYVVRDPGLPTLVGRYLYGDNAVSTLHSTPLAASGDRAEPLTVSGLSSFGEDACGRLYAASFNGPVYRIQDGAATACTFAPPTGGSAPTVPDTTAPRLSVAIGGLKTALKRRRLRLTMRCNEACRTTITTRLRNVRRLKTAHRPLAANAKTLVRLKLSRKTVRRLRAALQRRGAVRLSVSVRVTDTAGNTRRVVRRARLKR
jgi:Glucose / Sorbosone dehydrogenase